jgi:ubiquinone biosynthesis protein UbiJ
LFSESLLKPVENLLNRGIGQSTEAVKLCRELDGRSMAVTVTIQPMRSPLTIKIIANDDHVYLSADSHNEVDVEISGTMMELNRLMFSGSQLPLHDGRVQIQGDTDIAEQFRTLLLLARPDLEEELVEWVGDDAAPQIATAFRNIRSFAVGTLEDIAEQFSDYLKEDASPLPARAEIDRFFRDVDELSNDLARLDARISRIRERLESNGRGEG